MSDIDWERLRVALIKYKQKLNAYLEAEGTPNDFVPEIELIEAYSKVKQAKRHLGVPEWASIRIRKIDEG